VEYRFVISSKLELSSWTEAPYEDCIWVQPGGELCAEEGVRSNLVVEEENVFRFPALSFRV